VHYARGAPPILYVPTFPCKHFFLGIKKEARKLNERREVRT
jgi:hypothetical protein